MSEAERGEIMEALKMLPEDKKQFVLGYAAGVAAKSDSGSNDKEDKKHD